MQLRARTNPPLSLLAIIIFIYTNSPHRPHPSQPPAAPVVDMFAPQPAAPISSPGGTPAPVANPTFTAFSKENLTIEFETKKDDLSSQSCEVVATFKNSGSADMTGMNFQVAVPKYITMEVRNCEERSDELGMRQLRS